MYFLQRPKLWSGDTVVALHSTEYEGVPSHITQGNEKLGRMSHLFWQALASHKYTAALGTGLRIASTIKEISNFQRIISSKFCCKND